MFDSVFHGAPSSSTQPSGVVKSGIDVISGTMYFQSPNAAGWRAVSGTGGGGTPSGAVLLAPTSNQEINSNFELGIGDANPPTVMRATLNKQVGIEGAKTAVYVQTTDSAFAFGIQNIAAPASTEFSINVDSTGKTTLLSEAGGNISFNPDGSFLLLSNVSQLMLDDNGVEIDPGSGANTVQITKAAFLGSPVVAAGQIGASANHQTTVGSAGGASALPATPSGYWQINVEGTDFVVPYYAIA